MKNECAYCHKDLATLRTAWSVAGVMCCSEYCARRRFKKLMMADKDFDMLAEEVDTFDAGIRKVDGR